LGFYQRHGLQENWKQFNPAAEVDSEVEDLDVVAIAAPREYLLLFIVVVHSADLIVVLHKRIYI